MIRPAPGEQVISRRPNGLGPLLAGIVLTGAVAMAGYALATWTLLGAVHLRGLVEFLAVFTTINTVAQVLIRRRIDYCLTDHRLLIGPDRDIPLEDIRGLEVGPHSVTIRTPDAQHRIVALWRPAWLATRLNRCRTFVAADTGRVAT